MSAKTGSKTNKSAKFPQVNFKDIVVCGCKLKSTTLFFEIMTTDNIVTIRFNHRTKAYAFLNMMVEGYMNDKEGDAARGLEAVLIGLISTTLTMPTDSKCVKMNIDYLNEMLDEKQAVKEEDDLEPTEEELEIMKSAMGESFAEGEESKEPQSDLNE